MNVPSATRPAVDDSPDSGFLVPLPEGSKQLSVGFGLHPGFALLGWLGGDHRQCT